MQGVVRFRIRNVRTRIATAGPGFDSDGYWVEVDGVRAGIVRDNSSAVLGGLVSGSRSVSLTDVAANCSVTGASTFAIDVAAGDTADVSFDVFCQDASTLGSVQIDVATTGDSIDADGYIVLINGSPADSLALNGSLTLSALKPGTHTVELGSVEPPCIVENGSTRSVSVQAGTTSNESFVVTCPGSVPVGDVWVAVTTRGLDRDTTFTARAGDAEATIDMNGNVLFQGVPEGTTGVRLDDLPRECATQEANPATVSVIRGDQTDVAFTVVCGPTTVHSLAGNLGITGIQRSGNGALAAAVPGAARAAQVCWNNHLAGARGPRLASGTYAQYFRHCFLTLGIQDEVLELGIDGGFFGSATWTRTLSVDQSDTGGVYGEWTMEVPWNGETGTFAGYAAGSIDNGVLRLVIAARGNGPFQGLSVEIEVNGALEGPFTYTAIMVPDVW